MEIKLTNVLFFFRKKLLIVIMRSFIFLFCIAAFSLSPLDIASQNSKIKIKTDKSLTVDEVFDLIMKQTDYKFVYQEGIFDKHPSIDLKKGVISTNKLLQESLDSDDYNLVLSENNTILIKKKSIISSLFQRQKVSGKITDANGLPIVGATILVKGTTTGTISNFDGSYSITIPSTDNVLVVSFVGYQNQEILVGNKTIINIILKEELNTLDEVVITGYQKLSLNQSTGSVSKVKGEDIVKRGRSNLISALEGKIAGLGVTADINNEGGSKIDIRGISTVNGNSSPLIVIDGFPTQIDITQINPYDIESVTVLKDAGAASIYGAQAANGVIVITTKKGKKGTLNINYTQNITVNQKPDVRYRLNRLTGSDLVDAQIKATENLAPFVSFHSYQYELDNAFLPPAFIFPIAQARTQVFNAMANLNDGVITQAEADAIINPLRSIDNTNQIQDYFTQSPFEQQHNLSISGGGENNVFRATLNYTSNKTSFVGNKQDRILFDFQNSTDISKKVKLDINGNVTINDNKSIPYNRDIVFGQISPYELFADASGNPLPVTIGNIGEFYSVNTGGLFGGKDPIEIQRLIDLGLYDETYYPLRELNNYSNKANNLNTRLQAMLHADLAKGLKATVGFQYQISANRNTNISTEDSFEMKSLINNTASSNFNGDNTTLIIPRGGRLIETRGDTRSYTGRVQLDYETSYKKHNFRALAGTEIRHLFSSSITTDRFGYNEKSLNTVPVNKYTYGTDGLAQTLTGTNYPIFGFISEGLTFYDDISENTDRFFSAYGNFSYDFDNKYVLTGSVRLDQSNLFGTDPKFRYKPFWSVGGKWNIHEEDFFNIDAIDRLSLRASYGINGNIANLNGPFNVAQLGISGRAGFIEGAEIISPAVKNLRWERTATSNFGVDVSMLKNRVALSLDYYRKKTSDIFASGRNNPINGVNRILRNDATITNDGFEVSLNTRNITSNNFNWSSTLVFRHNKNNVEKINVQERFATSFVISPRNQTGNPANGLYVFDWAGIDNEGNATVRTKDGEIVTLAGSFNVGGDELIREDLVYAGTINPTFTGAITNNLNYKSFNLSFIFVTNQGHKLLKDSYNGETSPGQPQNINTDALFAWNAPGDETSTDIPQIGKSGIVASTTAVAKYSTKNVIDGGFVRLREVLLSYTLPQDAIKAIGAKNASINLRGNNLWLSTKNNEGIDPEAHGYGVRYFPRQASFTFGVNVNF